MNIVIIEDERPLAADLSRTIEAVEPEAKIIRVISSVEDGLQLLPVEKNIALIFADIQLGDGLSFEIFDAIKNLTPVVFCTAFDHYALRAFDAFGIDYIIKPITKESVKRAIDKFKQLTTTSTPIPDVVGLIDQFYPHLHREQLPCIIVRHRDQALPLSSEEIRLFAIEDDGLFVYTFDNKRWKVNHTMDFLESKFTPLFFRANRQYLINRKIVVAAHLHLHRKMALKLNFVYPKMIIVGKEKVSHLLSWLSNS